VKISICTFNQGYTKFLLIPISTFEHTNNPFFSFIRLFKIELKVCISNVCCLQKV